MEGEDGVESAARPPRGAEEPMELLLPDADAALVRHAERLADCLRLLALDGRARQAGAVAVDPARARVELEAREARGRVRDLSDLVRAHLAAHLAGATFLDLGPVPADPEGAWERVLEARAELGARTVLPDPGESALRVAQRLLGLLEGLLQRTDPRAARAAAELWRIWLARAEGSPQEGEERALAALETKSPRSPAAERAPLVAAVAACRLDRAAVREADLWLAEHCGLARGSGELSRLWLWTRLLLGDEAGARRLLPGACAARGPLPQALVELRAACPAWSPLLAGRAPEAGLATHALARGAPGDAQDPRCLRRALGAAVLAVVAFEPGAGASVRGLELAPGLRARARAWLERHEGAHTLPGEPEHRLLLEAQPVVQHRQPGRELRGALGEIGSRALCLIPILDAGGDVVGWVHLECEHHLLPPRQHLARLAEVLRPRLAEPSASRSGPRGGGSIAAEPPPAGSGAPWARGAPERPLSGRVFEGLARALDMKTRERRWWGFELLEGRPHLVAEGGEGLGGVLDGARGGGGRALRRALASSGVVGFEEPDPDLALCAGAGSGVVVPLLVRGRCVGLFAVESRRRRDLGAGERGRIRAAAEGLALALALAQVRAWHQERYGFDLCIDTSLPGLRAAGERAVAAGRSGQPALIVGPQGAGKLVLARWLHFEGAGAEAPLGVVPLGREEPAELERHLELHRAGSVLLEPLEQASPALQAALLARLERGARGAARLLVLAGAAPRELAARGLVRADLAARLERLTLFVPPLADRREELIGLARFLCERFAREEGTRPPRLDGSALALLWRQPWPGNVRQLESWIFELCLLHPDAEVGAVQVLEAARRLRQPVLGKLHSRHPRRRDLVAALRSALTKTGRVNKTRAAQLLGWDPDTLVARLREARLGPEALEAEPWGW